MRRPPRLPSSAGLLAALLALLLALARGASADNLLHPFSIYVEGGAEECFYQDLKEGTVVSFLFEASEGEDFIVRASVNGPDGKSIYDHVAQEDFVSHTATQAGEHAFCFGNDMSNDRKKVNFNILVEDDLDGDGSDGTPARNLTGLAETNPALAATFAAVGTITSRVQNVTRLLDAHALRMHRHAYLAESLLERVQRYGTARAAAAVAWAVASVLVIRSFFSQRASYVGGRASRVNI